MSEEYKIPYPPIELSLLTKEELDNALTALAETIESFFHYNFGKQYAFIVGIGEVGGYRGTVTNLQLDNNTEKLGDMIVAWGENVKAGQKEW